MILQNFRKIFIQTLLAIGVKYSSTPKKIELKHTLWQ